MVKCKLYVGTTMFLCALLVVSSVTNGMTVGDRIAGVDPFNMTTYGWVLAAFVLLVVESVRVDQWSWNDFLHGHVLCKSVSELSSVTGIDEQLILAKLLQDESESFLEARGPYNVVFCRKYGDGFSIDAPLSTQTMLFSGLFMLEVESAGRKNLICLDLRKGTETAVIKKLGPSCVLSEEYIYDVMEEKRGDGKRIRLTEGKLSWSRILGFSSNEDAEYV